MPQEVTEEKRENLHVLELDRTPRPQKLAAERAYFDGAHEVRFTERTFRPRHGADLDEVRAFVDSLEVKRREIPPLPEPPAVVPVSVPAKIPEHYREPLERAIRGLLISVETVHRVGTGVVVDVAWESEDEGERRGLFVLENDEARPFDAVTSKVDELPAPKVEPPAPEPMASAPETMPEPTRAADPEPKKKGLMGRLGRKDKDAKPAPEAEPERVAQPEGKKRRFGFGRK